MSKALTNLQECLSVCLWCYNDKMILQRIAISNDMDFWDFMGYFLQVWENFFYFFEQQIYITAS